MRRLNRYVEETRPFDLAKDDGQAERLDQVLLSLSEGLRMVTLALVPFIPDAADKLLAALGEEGRALAEFGSRGGGATVERIDALFEARGSHDLVRLAFRADQLRKRYDATDALRGVSLDVVEGEVVGLLGPNGAGKSTLAKIACGLVRPSEGRAEVDGHEAGSLPARAAVGYLAELFGFPPGARPTSFSPCTSAWLARPAGVRSGTRCSISWVSRTPPGPGSVRCRRACSNGSGSRRPLWAAPGSCCSTSPPARSTRPAGGSFAGCWTSCGGRGVSVLLSSHLLSEVELVCDRVAILVGGEIVERGTPATLVRPRGIEVETAAGKRLIEGAGREDAPRIVAELVAAGERVYGVGVLSSTLEDAYLEAVGEETG